MFLHGKKCIIYIFWAVLVEGVRLLLLFCPLICRTEYCCVPRPQPGLVAGWRLYDPPPPRFSSWAVRFVSPCQYQPSNVCQHPSILRPAPQCWQAGNPIGEHQLWGFNACCTMAFIWVWRLIVYMGLVMDYMDLEVSTYLDLDNIMVAFRKKLGTLLR